MSMVLACERLEYSGAQARRCRLAHVLWALARVGLMALLARVTNRSELFVSAEYAFWLSDRSIIALLTDKR